MDVDLCPEVSTKNSVSRLPADGSVGVRRLITRSKRVAFSWRFLAFVGALLLSPIALASSGEMREKVGGLLGECEASVSGTPELIELRFDSEISKREATLVSGASAILREGQGSDVRLMRPESPNTPLYSHWDSRYVSSTTLKGFELATLRYHPEAMLRVLPTAPRMGAVAPNGFTVVPATPGTTLPYEDPRHAFYLEPELPKIRAALDGFEIVGDFVVLIENVEFLVTDSKATNRYDARDSKTGGSSAYVDNVHYFVLEVTNGRLAVSQLVGTDFLAADAVLGCTGSLFEMTPVTRVGEVSSPRLIATGSFTVRSSVEDGLIAAVIEEMQPQGSAGTATTVAVPNGGQPYWTLFAIITLTATASGLVVSRLRNTASAGPVVVPVPASTPAPQPSPAAARRPESPKPGARSISELESAFREDSSDIAVALELGLAYSKSQRPHDALPLLQLAIQAYPKLDAARYFGAVTLLELGRVDEAVRHLSYAFRLNPLNVARFINEGAAEIHGRHPKVRGLLASWSRRFQEANARGYV
jgi:hypothetical protein